MLEIKGVKISPSLFGKFFFGLYSHHAMHTTVLVLKQSIGINQNSSRSEKFQNFIEP